eukprot:CAMPEP_0197650934 /NCGR_PEP_ID=MMETSP1338-20131121/31249_1 /TAXON_ID=43686 ORGANISM="Pelagodinium beii, Strain RCC1491" /NCGR_SAMPLE_ID=MMETSP1338 /ASSEMBLY_ACC=CAM_ASM_000754 /LENGTH=371 /DNA_ID=CAMNT_0043225453 /DNA_START=62 /DNA_END=1177 /DNA_ORIENTATION=-
MPAQAADAAQASLAPTPSLRVRNTFIDDIPETPPSPLGLQKFESCPAAFAPKSLHDSLIKASESDATECESPCMRRNGEGLEVNFRDSAQVSHARIQAAAMLGVNPCCVRLIDGAGNCVEDDSFVHDLWSDGLHLDVLPQEDLRQKELAYQLSEIMSKASREEEGDFLESLDTFRIESEEDLSFVVKFIVTWALQNPCLAQTCADVMLALHKRYPSIEPSAPDGKPTSFTRVVRIVCQKEYEQLLSTATTKVGNSAAAHARLFALLSLLGQLYMRRLLVFKVIEQILQDMLPSEGVVAIHVKCSCQLIEAVANTPDRSKKEDGLLISVLQKIDDLKNATTPDSRPLLTGHVRLRMESLLHVHASKFTAVKQ